MLLLERRANPLEKDLEGDAWTRFVIQDLSGKHGSLISCGKRP